GYRWGLNYGTGTNAIIGLRTTFSFNKDKKGNTYSMFIPSVEFGSHFTFNKYAKGGYFTPSVGLAYPFTMSGGSQTDADHKGIEFNTRLGLGYRF
ncbi:MAG TPA: hypothetical protein VLJ68_02735, partial [Chitinophagaceae bacterium]|nr:hypothetical protein [Chitinophagaceae bacterium]